MCAGAVVLVSCSPERETSTGSASPSEALTRAPAFDPDSIIRGAQLFAVHCAQCHGPQAQGHPDWETPVDGSFAAAPPLDGTGNDWKKSQAQLVATIRNGARRRDGTEIMPAWKGRLSDHEILDLLNWLQSLWPAKVYDEWLQAHAKAAAPTSGSKR